MFPSLWLRSALAALLVLNGCGTRGPAMGTVSGVITYRDKPLAGATVTFLPVSTGANSLQAAMGVTNEEGKYQLGTFRATDGALVGEHVVTIVAREAYSGAIPAGAGAAYAEEVQTRAAPKIPPRYFSAGTSSLRATVKPGHNVADFALHDKAP